MNTSSTSKLLMVGIICGFLAGAVGGGVTAMAVLTFGNSSFSESFQATTTNSTMALPDIKYLGEDGRVIDMVKRASQAVVSINITKEVTSRPRVFVDPFEEFFSSPFAYPGQSSSDRSEIKQKLRIGGGSGFFVSSDGLIATNRHVVSDEKAEYTVTTFAGKNIIAKVLAIDPVLDLAILKVEGTDFPFLELGNSDEMSVGQTAIAIGYALAEFENSVTKGIISGINRRIVAGGDSMSAPEVIEAAIQTDAAINPGNSGGPLLSLGGRVIGVNTAISEEAQSLGFAIPSNLLKNAIESVKKNGRIVRPWIGVRYIMIDEELAKKNNLKVQTGVLVTRGDTREELAIIPGSPADKANLRENDIILSVNGYMIDDKNSLSTILQRYAPGDIITLKMIRQDKEMEVKVTLEERK